VLFRSVGSHAGKRKHEESSVGTLRGVPEAAVSVPTICPGCKADLKGDPIPEKDRESFGNETHFSRVTGVTERDRTQHWTCPDCGHTWKRTSDENY